MTEPRENTWGVTIEQFDFQSAPKVCPVCPFCNTCIDSWRDARNYCPECGERLYGRKGLIVKYHSGKVGDYEQDKKIMKERYGIDI